MRRYVQSKESVLVDYLVFVLLIVIVTSGALMGCPGFVEAQGKAREAEIKSNIHAIQIALERYAVDTGGYYPYILYGGDETDTFVKPGGGALNLETGVTPYYPPEEPEYKPFQSDCDALIQFGYLAQYPSNPLVDPLKEKIRTDPAANGFGPLELSFDKLGVVRTNIWTKPFDRALHCVRRDVGGASGNLMWDVSEGQRHPPWPIIVVPNPQPHWTGYVNPVLEPGAKAGREKFRDDYQFWLTPGNFYYYAVFEDPGGYSAFAAAEAGPNPDVPIAGLPINYNLCGYGEMQNAGQDVYNLWGDFTERSLFTVNERPATGTSIAAAYVGPDGRRDGVIIVVSGGASIRSGPAPGVPIDQEQQPEEEKATPSEPRW